MKNTTLQNQCQSKSFIHSEHDKYNSLDSIYPSELQILVALNFKPEVNDKLAFERIDNLLVEIFNEELLIDLSISILFSKQDPTGCLRFGLILNYDTNAHIGIGIGTHIGHDWYQKIKKSFYKKWAKVNHHNDIFFIRDRTKFKFTRVTDDTQIESFFDDIIMDKCADDSQGFYHPNIHNLFNKANRVAYKQCANLNVEKPINDGLPWTEDYKALLTAKFNTHKMGLHSLANYLGRSHCATSDQLVKLKLMPLRYQWHEHIH